MVTVGMYYEVIPGKAAEFRAKFEEVLAVLGKIAGHRRSYLYQRVDDPDSYAILSEWHDRESFEAFVHSDIFREVTSWGREQILRGAPRHTVYPSAEEFGRP
jgi:heme-degrading monooxygenase HmoA